MEQATKIFNRMTEVEKITVRHATPGNLDYLSDTAFLVDMPLAHADDRHAILAEVRALCILEFSTKSAVVNFQGVTWQV